MSPSYAASTRPVMLEADLGSPEELREVRARFLPLERKIRSIGTVFAFFGGLTVGAGLLLPLAGPGGLAAAEPSLLIGALFLATIGMPQLVVGIAARRLGGWTRLPLAILASLSLIGFPMGTLIGIYTLVTLCTSGAGYVMSPAYRAVVTATPEMHPRGAALRILVLFAVLVLVFLVGVAFVAGGS